MPTYKIHVDINPGNVDKDDPKLPIVHAVELYVSCDSILPAAEEAYGRINAAFGIDKSCVNRIVEIQSDKRPINAICPACVKPMIDLVELRYPCRNDHIAFRRLNGIGRDV